MNSERLQKEELWIAIFSVRLSRFLKDANMTVKELSKCTGISSKVIYSYLEGRTSPKAFNVYLIAKVLKISFDDILGL